MGLLVSFKKFITAILLFSMLLSNTLTIYAEDSRTAKISEVEGSVQIMKAGGEKSFKAFVGMSLSEGDRIITGSKSSMTIELDDDKEVKVGDNTQMSLSELRGSLVSQDDQTSLGLLVGKVWSNIKKKLNIRGKYEIKTPTAVMGARGTMFSVSVTVSNSSSGSGSGTGGQNVSVSVAVLEGTVSASITQAIQDLVSQAVQLNQLDVLLGQNQQIQVNDTQPAGQQPQVQQVTNLNLDLFTLQNVQQAAQQNPRRVDPGLLNNINQVIQQLQQEEQRQEEQRQQQEQQLPPEPSQPQIQQDSTVTNSQTQSSSNSRGSTETQTQTQQQPAMVKNYIDAYAIMGELTVRASFQYASALSIRVLDSEMNTESNTTSVLNGSNREITLKCSNSYNYYEVTATSQSTGIAITYTGSLNNIPNLSGNPGIVSSTSAVNVKIFSCLSSSAAVLIRIENDSTGAARVQREVEFGGQSGPIYILDETIEIPSDLLTGIYDVVVYFRQPDGSYCGIVFGYVNKTSAGTAVIPVNLPQQA